MFDRDVMPRLSWAMLLAVVIHVVAVPLMAHLLLDGPGNQTQTELPELDDEAESEQEESVEQPAEDPLQEMEEAVTELQPSLPQEGSALSDLTVDGIEIPKKITQGQSFQLGFSIANRGQAVTDVTNWSDGVFISRDARLSEDDLQLISQARAQAIAPAENYDVLLPEMAIPESFGRGGKVFIIVATDIGGQVAESREDNNARAVSFRLVEPRETMPIGKADAPERMTVSWIPHDAFEELMGQKSDVEQPALQREVDPVPGAPLRVIDATPPSTPASASAPASPPAAGPPVTQVIVILPEEPVADATPPSASAPPVAPVEPQVQELPVQEPRVVEEQMALAPELPPTSRPDALQVGGKPDGTPDALETVESQLETKSESESKPVLVVPKPVAPVEQKPEPVPSEPKTEPREKVVEEFAKKQTPGQTLPQVLIIPAAPQVPQPISPAPTTNNEQPKEKPLPTGAPRSDHESPIVARIDTGRRQQGRVEVSKGLELLPVMPRVDVITRRTVIPRDPTARMIFNRRGEVVKAEMVQSTGHAGWDSPILNSLYRWRAVGPMLEKLEEDLELTVQLDLH